MRKLLLGLVVIAALVAGAMAVRRWLWPQPHIALDPAIVELPRGYLHGTPLEVQFTLTNESAVPLSIERLSGSCGCMVLSARHGAVKIPFELDEHASMPIALKVKTEASNGVGKRRFDVFAVARDAAGNETFASSTVKVELLSALQAEPNPVLFRDAQPGEPLIAEIEIADTLPDPGVTIREIQVSSPDAMRVESTFDVGPSNIFTTAPGRTRATLKLYYTPGPNAQNARQKIVIVPDDDRYPQLEVPVVCDLADPPFRFVPDGLSFTAPSAAGVSRKIAFRAKGPTSLAVSKCPPGVDVQITDGPRDKLIRLTCQASAFSEGDCEVEFLVGGQPYAYPLRHRPLE